MTIAETALIGGILLGLASTLHCGTMCGGIACTLSLTIGKPTPLARLRHLLVLQAGRIMTYSVIGGVAAGIGSELVFPASGANYRFMQWAAAVSLMWVGMAMAGLLPRFAVLDNGMLRLSEAVGSLARPFQRVPVAGPLMLGAIWGLNACPMVYGAAFTASLTGSAGSGALFMLGFGMGTIPSVISAAFGVQLLKRLTGRRALQSAAGISIALIGVASVLAPWPALDGLCLTP